MTNVIALIVGIFIGYAWWELHLYCRKRRADKRAKNTMAVYDSLPYAIVTKIPPYASDQAKQSFIVGGIYPKAFLDDHYIESLECNGQLYDPDYYPQLKLMLRDTFGVNRVPDYRGRVIR